MSADTMIDDLYRCNSWANGRILKLCEGLTDEQLDQPREIGFGSLRSTLFHMLAAEEIWLERWAGQPWRPFSFEPQGASIEQISARLGEVAERRAQLIDAERPSQWQRQVNYLDSSQKPHTRRLEDLLIHVTNHGVHHRAQALHYLKQFGHTVPVGLDYLVFKLAYPTLRQEQATIDAMRQYGLEVEIGPGVPVAFNLGHIQSYYAYHDWAMRQLVTAALPLDLAALDRDFAMGVGSIRKTFQHLFDVEPWWLKNWASEPALIRSEPDSRSLSTQYESWLTTAEERNAFIAQLNEQGAAREVVMVFGGPPLRFRVIESLIQICVHATHHRAQLINMLRHSGVQPPGLDFPMWVAQRDLANTT